MQSIIQLHPVCSNSTVKQVIIILKNHEHYVFLSFHFRIILPLISSSSLSAAPAICSTKPTAPCCLHWAYVAGERKLQQGDTSFLYPSCDADGSFRPGPQPTFSADGKIFYQCRKSSGEAYKGMYNGKLVWYGYDTVGFICDEKMAELVERIMRQRI